MKRSEIVDRIAAEFDRKLTGTFDTRATAEEIVAAFDPVVHWDAEDAEAPLPNQLFLSERFLHPKDGHGENAWFVRDALGGVAFLAVYHHGAFPRPSTLPERLLKALVAAYNRQRVEDEIDAETEKVLGDFEEKLQKVAAEELQVQIDKAVEKERARCLEHVDWLLSCLPRGWDYALRMTQAVRRKIETGWNGRSGAVLIPRCVELGCSEPAIAPQRCADHAHAPKDAEESLLRLAREASVADDGGPAGIVAAVLGRLADKDVSLGAEERRREEAEEMLREIEVALNRPVSLGQREIASEAIKEIRLAAMSKRANTDEPRRGSLAAWSEPFSDARIALDQVQLSFEEALQHGIAAGSFTTKVGTVTVELQWPWLGGWPVFDHDFRFYVEGRFNPRPGESKK